MTYKVYKGWDSCDSTTLPFMISELPTREETCFFYLKNKMLSKVGCLFDVSIKYLKGIGGVG